MEVAAPRCGGCWACDLPLRLPALRLYLGVDQFFDLGEIGRDIVKRKFITVGFLAFLLLVPLAVTSTDGW